MHCILTLLFTSIYLSIASPQLQAAPHVQVLVGENLPKPIGHFRFNGSYVNSGTGEVKISITNAPIKNNALCLNGIYQHSGKDSEKRASRAYFWVPSMDYNYFTIALRIRPEELKRDTSNLITGGHSARWFGLNFDTNGHLQVTLNNQDFTKSFPSHKLEMWRWSVIACSVDLSKGVILVYFNSEKAGEVQLPADFKLRVMDGDWSKSDKHWTFTNYSNGRSLKGMVDEMIIYDVALSDAQMKAIPLKR